MFLNTCYFLLWMPSEFFTRILCSIEDQYFNIWLLRCTILYFRFPWEFFQWVYFSITALKIYHFPVHLYSCVYLGTGRTNDRVKSLMWYINLFLWLFCDDAEVISICIGNRDRGLRPCRDRMKRWWIRFEARWQRQRYQSLN